MNTFYYFDFNTCPGDIGEPSALYPVAEILLRLAITDHATPVFADILLGSSPATIT